MPLTLTPVTPGTLTAVAAPVSQSDAVICSEGLPCSESLPCGEIGLGLTVLDPAAPLTLTPVSPA